MSMQKKIDTADSVTHSKMSRPGPRPRGKADVSTMGGRIEAARLTVEMTQQQLADQVGVTRPVIVYIEKGRRKSIKRDQLELIGEVTHHRVEWLAYGTGPRLITDDPQDMEITKTAAKMTEQELADSALAVILTLSPAMQTQFFSDLEELLDP